MPSQSTLSIARQMKVFARPVTRYELRAVGGFTDKQIERAIRDGVLEPNDKLTLRLKQPKEKEVMNDQSRTV